MGRLTGDGHLLVDVIKPAQQLHNRLQLRLLSLGDMRLPSLCPQRISLDSLETAVRVLSNHYREIFWETRPRFSGE